MLVEHELPNKKWTFKGMQWHSDPSIGALPIVLKENNNDVFQAIDIKKIFNRVVCIESPSQYDVDGDRSGGNIKHIQLRIPRRIINDATIPISPLYWTHR